MNSKRKKVRISSLASDVWSKKICPVILDKEYGRPVTMKQIRSHPPTEGRWNTAQESKNIGLYVLSLTFVQPIPSITITISCLNCSETCCSGPRISFCSCISSAFHRDIRVVGDDCVNDFTDIRMTMESPKKNSALFRPRACCEKKLPSYFAAAHQSDWGIAILPASLGH